MAEPTSDELRTRYRELLNTASTKLVADKETNTEASELMEICRILTQRGYVTNTDASDWVLDLSPHGWLVEDEY